jgi:hypothetical protein
MSLVSDIFHEPKKRGRPSAVSKFPEIIPVVKQFVQENNLQANMKRGSERPFLFGTTCADVKKEIEAKVPEVLSEFPKFSDCM